MGKLSSFFKSVRFRLTLWYVGILALVLAVFSGVVYILLTNSLHTGLDDLLQARVSQVSSTYNISDSQINLQEQDENCQSVPAEGEIALLVNPQGQVIQKSGRLSSSDLAGLTGLATTGLTGNSQPYFTDYNLFPNAVTNGNQGSQIQIEYRILVAPVVDGGRAVGILVLGRSRESTEAISHNLLTLLLLAAPLALLTSASGGYWLASRAMRPVRTITLAAREMSESDLSRRLNLNRNDELGELASTFDGMLMRLQAAFERQRQFTADASHELRTPLSIVQLEAEQALVGVSTKEAYRQALTTILSESDHMVRLVNDLLLLARADAGRPVFKPESIDLSEVVLEVVERLRPLAAQQGVSLKMAGGELPELAIKGDYSLLSQMLINLVENAIKYTAAKKIIAPANSSPLPFHLPTGISADELTDDRHFDDPQLKWVRVEVGQAGKEWSWVRVLDNGPGIASSHLPHLFDRFYQVDPARTHSNPIGVEAGNEPVEAQTTAWPSGSGLGLAIVKWVIEAHHGQIKVESPVKGRQGGASFEIWLPLSID